MTLTGTLHGNVITLDASELSPEESRLEGRRVRVSVGPLDDGDLELAPAEQAKLWQRWVESGPQGPIKDDEGDAVLIALGLDS
ncbi:MAG TPA: hypothetical protein VGG06_17745 [Thermoanaerobaculia bacterium]|jgi:hypothetical protein